MRHPKYRLQYATPVILIQFRVKSLKIPSGSRQRFSIELSQCHNRIARQGKSHENHKFGWNSSLGEGTAAAVGAVGGRAVGAIAVGVAVAAGREAGLLRQALGQLLGVGQAVLSCYAELTRRRVRLGVREVQLLHFEFLRISKADNGHEEREGLPKRHSFSQHSQH